MVLAGDPFNNRETPKASAEVSQGLGHPRVSQDTKGLAVSPGWNPATEGLQGTDYSSLVRPSSVHIRALPRNLATPGDRQRELECE